MKILLSLALLSFTSLHAEVRDLQGVAEVLRARTDYQRMLIEAQLADSKALEMRANAELKFAQAAYYRRMQIVLEHEFDRIKREEINVKSRISEIEFYASRCATLKIGEVTGVTFFGLRWLLIAVLPADIIALEMSKPVPALGAENFHRRGRRAARAFPGGNLGQLLKFLEANEYSMEEWSEPHLAVLKLMASVVASVNLEVLRYQGYMQGIRSGSLDVWKLPKE